MTDQRDIEEIERLLAGRSLKRPSEAARRRALALGERLRDLEARPWWAELTFDSALAAPAAGVRSAVSDVRRLVYALHDRVGGQEVMIDLALETSDDDRLELRGQIVPMLDGVAVEVRFGKQARRARVEPTGEFGATLPRGRSEAELSLMLFKDDDELAELGPLSSEVDGGPAA